MGFLAAMLHGMVIAGISFSAADLGDGAGAPGVEVARLSETRSEELRRDKAAYLAEATQRGSGTTRERVAAETPAGAAPGLPEPPSAERGGDSANPAAEGEAVLATSAQRLEVRYFVSSSAGAELIPLGTPEALALQGSSATTEARLTGPESSSEWLTADTSASIVAPYLEGWRSKVERLGTLNYPTLARRLESRVSPVLAVELGADGRLRRVSIQRSSGNPEIDQAALEILKLASPFDPFPKGLAAQYPRLRFAYEWRFDRGGARTGAAGDSPAYSSP
jgi:protein TonB